MGTQVGTCFSTTIDMFTQLDYELFPNNPEVYLLPSGDFVAKILKNASSSLDRQGYKLATPEEIYEASVITAYWREPIARFKSGLSTFLQQDDIPVEYATRFLFLNKHYAPQFYTLINLRRYMNKTACFSFKSIDEVSDITDFHEVPYKTIDVPVTDKVHFYMTCDKMIWERCLGDKLHMDELMRLLKVDYKDYYKEVIEHSKNIYASI